MSGSLLRSGTTREFYALGAFGTPVYSAAGQLRSAIRRQIGDDVADCLAIPQSNDQGDNLDWYAPFAGDVVPWTAASDEERSLAADALKRLQSRIHETSQRLQEQRELSRERQIFLRLLGLSDRIPDESHIYLVDGRPVITFWGFTNSADDADRNVLANLRAPPPAAPAPGDGVAGAAVASAGPHVERRATAWPWWRWLLWLLPLLFLFALVLFGLRFCTATGTLPAWVPGVPGVTAPGLGLDEPGGVGDDDIVVVGPTYNGGSDVVVTDDVPAAGTDRVLGSEGDATTPGRGLDEPGDSTAEAPSEPGAPTSSNQAVPPTGGDEALPPEVEPGAPSTGDAATQPAPPDVDLPEAAEPGSPEPPGPESRQALELPSQALEEGDLRFLDGHWRSRTPLLDSETGQPLNVEYDFQNGKGRSIITRSDGVKCVAPAQATVDDGKLIIEDLDVVRCADGRLYDKSRVVCTQNAQGGADCRGTHGEGQSYDVQVER